MKKLIIVLVLLLAATALFGQVTNALQSVATAVGGGKINLGNFPAGKWLDPNYDAIWEFSSNNIRILDSNSGDLYWEFASKTIQGFKVTASGIQPIVSFSCPEAGRTYSFKADPGTLTVTMEIERDDQPKYTVAMKKQ